MQELERQINRLCRLDWRWCDLRLSVVERHPTYVIYEIHHHDKYAGQAMVMPFASARGTGVSQSALSDQALYLKIRARIESRITSKPGPLRHPRSALFFIAVTITTLAPARQRQHHPSWGRFPIGAVSYVKPT